MLTTLLVTLGLSWPLLAARRGQGEPGGPRELPGLPSGSSLGSLALPHGITRPVTGHESVIGFAWMLLPGSSHPLALPGSAGLLLASHGPPWLLLDPVGSSWLFLAPL